MKIQSLPIILSLVSYGIAMEPADGPNSESNKDVSRLLHLPREVLGQIFTVLPPTEQGTVGEINADFHSIVIPEMKREMEQLLGQIIENKDGNDVDGIINKISELHLELQFDEEFLYHRLDYIRKWIDEMQSNQIPPIVIGKVKMALGIKTQTEQYTSYYEDGFQQFTRTEYPYQHLFIDTMRKMEEDLRMNTPKLWRKQHVVSMWEQLSEVGELPPLDEMFEDVHHEGLQFMVRKLGLTLIHPFHLERHREMHRGADWRMMWSEWKKRGYPNFVSHDGDGRYFELRTEARLFTRQLRECRDMLCKPVLWAQEEKLSSILSRLSELPHLQNVMDPLPEACLAATKNPSLSLMDSTRLLLEKATARVKTTQSPVRQRRIRFPKKNKLKDKRKKRKHR